MAETTTRFLNWSPRSWNGASSGGGTGPLATPPPFPGEDPPAPTPAAPAARSANQRSTRAVKPGSRRARLECVMRRLRVMRLKANCSGSVSMNRSVPLEPLETRLGGPLHALDFGPAGGLVGRQGRSHVQVCVASSDWCSEIASIIASRVPEPMEKWAECAASPMSTDAPVTPGVIPDGREGPPDGAVRDEPMGIQFLAKEVLEEGDGLLL